MKGLLIFGLLSLGLVGVYCQDLISTDDSDVKAKCIEESGVDVEILKEIDRTNTFIQDDKFGCFLACLYKDKGAFDENGAIKSTHPNYPQDTKSKECANLRGKNDCETANKVSECLINVAAAAGKEE